MCALTAIAACVATRIDPFDTIVRGLLAFAAGHLAGAVWDAIFGIREAELTIPVEFEVHRADPVRPDNGEAANGPSPQEEAA